MKPVFLMKLWKCFVNIQIFKNMKQTTHRQYLSLILKYYQIKERYIAGNEKYF